MFHLIIKATSGNLHPFKPSRNGSKIERLWLFSTHKTHDGPKLCTQVRYLQHPRAFCKQCTHLRTQGWSPTSLPVSCSQLAAIIHIKTITNNSVKTLRHPKSNTHQAHYPFFCGALANAQEAPLSRIYSKMLKTALMWNGTKKNHLTVLTQIYT